MKYPVRQQEGSRLVYYGEANDERYWDTYWLEHLSRQWYTRYEKGSLLFFGGIFRKYLPKPGRILEAGCGLGQMVMALRYHGYDCEGVEWAENTVQAVQRLYPDLPVRTGDITSLEQPDGWYDACVSLGVVEHRQDGPEPYLAEAYRLLSPEGILLVSVPYFSPLRQRRVWKGCALAPSAGEAFSYYAFTTPEMEAILERMGFEVLEILPYDIYLGLKEELPGLKMLFDLPHMSFAVNTLLRGWRWGRRQMSHMVMFACRKKAGMPGAFQAQGRQP
ncbi:MAG: methyltransferase domain-containing protein [Anaerolineae bacterium]|nr:methyltransferase domain-containing protein [Anaerolineae bacterium]